MIIAVAVWGPGGCDTLSTSSPLDRLNAVLQKLPTADVGAKSVLPGAVGPPETLFGVLLEDGTQAFAIGGEDAAGNPIITAVALYDADGRLMMQQNIADGVTTLFGPSVDGLKLDVRGAKPRITMILSASSPPSEIAMIVQSDGSVVVDETATVIRLGENGEYNGAGERLRIADGVGAAGKPRDAALPKLDCTNVTSVILTATQIACDIKTQITNGIPVKAIEAACVSATGAIDLVRGIESKNEDATVQRVLAGLKAGVLAMCQVGQAAVKVGSTVSKINPLGVACVVLGYAEAGVTIRTGESLAQQICTIFTSDQVMGGDVTTDDLINLVLLDYGSQDGDAVAIRLNGQEVLRTTVTTAPRALAVNLYPGLNHFEFVALNEGTQPPNTARVIVRDVEGTDLNLSSYDLKVGQVATLDLVRK